MNNSLRILHLEDNPLDAELIEEMLVGEGISCQIKRVETRGDFVDALAGQEFDMVLSDYSLPAFDGLSAMAIVRDRYPTIPFLIVTGTLGEEVVIETLKSGATDYVLKQHLARLAPSVHRALREARDRKERKRAEEALRDSLALCTTLIENLQMGVLVEDASRRILNANKTFCDLFGIEDSRSLIDANCAEALELAKSLFVNQEDFMQRIEERIQNGRTVIAEEEIMTDGRILERDYVPILIGKERFAHLWLYHDMTERKNLEEQFRQSQKMDAIGRLAGGIAHDFNNLLTVIIGFSSLLMYRLEEEAGGRKEVEEIEKAARRAAALTGQLLAFSRKQVLQPEVLDLNAILSDMNKMLRRIIGEDIELITLPDPELGQVKADPGQIEQIIMNLAVNARDAMPQGGKLTIATTTVELDEGYAFSHAQVQPGCYVLLTVSDTGLGMDKQTQSRIFEPFFTTKDQGKGTGLGLSTVYGIVKQSNGHIWVYSEPGYGTSFKIYLPCLRNAASTKTIKENHAALRKATETILLVEDEEVLRKLVSQILALKGYRVIEAHNGNHAVELCAQYEETIHLIITDVIMPQMDGVELAKRLLAMRPELKLLFMTGYTSDIILHHGMLEKDLALLQKPFSPDALIDKVCEVLDTPKKQ
jgi:two-component system cell cycle sensor histidine kinase/response regulator CckA